MSMRKYISLFYCLWLPGVLFSQQDSLITQDSLKGSYSLFRTCVDHFQNMCFFYTIENADTYGQTCAIKVNKSGAVLWCQELYNDSLCFQQRPVDIYSTGDNYVILFQGYTKKDSSGKIIALLLDENGRCIKNTAIPGRLISEPFKAKNNSRLFYTGISLGYYSTAICENIVRLSSSCEFSIVQRSIPVSISNAVSEGRVFYLYDDGSSIVVNYDEKDRTKVFWDSSYVISKCDSVGRTIWKYSFPKYCPIVDVSSDMEGYFYVLRYTRKPFVDKAASTASNSKNGSLPLVYDYYVDRYSTNGKMTSAKFETLNNSVGPIVSLGTILHSSSDCIDLFALETFYTPLLYCLSGKQYSKMKRIRPSSNIAFNPELLITDAISLEGGVIWIGQKKMEDGNYKPCWIISKFV